MSTRKEDGVGTEPVKQFLSFAVGEEDYAVDILCVQEIKCYSAVTPVPHAPVHVKGVMNLRGAVVPVVDLRVRFGARECAYTPVTVVVLVLVKNKVVGLIVDRVSDVLDIAQSCISAAPDFGNTVDTSCLLGVARVDERLLGLIDVDVAASVEAQLPGRSMRAE